MDIYNYLKKDHRRIADLMAQVLAARGPDRREDIFDEIKHQLTLHSETEEETFYAALEDEEETEETIEMAEEDHDDIKRLMMKLSAMSADTEKWLEVFGEFKHAVEHHVKDEEGRIFEKARMILDEEEEEQLAEDMDRLKHDNMKEAA